LRGGLGALGVGLTRVGAPLGLAGAAGAATRRARGTGTSGASVQGSVSAVGNPFLALEPLPPSTLVDGLPFARWFTGDDFLQPSEIPFHTTFTGPYPAPEETIDVAVVGGGLSGLAAAYALSDRRPVLFDLRPRFGGNALGESWREARFSLGSAYVIVPDQNSELDRLYRALNLDRVQRESYPPDPIELHGRVEADFWSGEGQSSDEVRLMRRYAEVVQQMAEVEYPEIPLIGDPVADGTVRRLDQLNFREDLERRMGVALSPRLAAALQAYFYSSFGAGMELISAASGWNFVAAEEYGRLVFPGGNASMAFGFWHALAQIEAAGGTPQRMLRPGSRVVDVRRVGAHQRVTWIDASGNVRALDARHVVMAGAKQITKYVLADLATGAPETLEAMENVETMAYVVANVLLDAPVIRDFYDLFLIGDETAFPMTPGETEARSRPADIVNGNFALRPDTPRGALTFYWPLPWFTARFSVLVNDPWQRYTSACVEPVRYGLRLLGIPEQTVRQIRLTRFGHAMPLAKPHFIASGMAERFIDPFDGNVHFANQDNWSLPAVENSLMDSLRVAASIQAALG